MAARASVLLRASTGFAAAALLLLTTPASAAGLFEMLFGAFHRHSPPPEAQAYAEPFAGFFRGPERQVSRSDGPASAYCVRMSDGFYFPVQAHAGVTAAAACQALCPANQTRLYSGSGIDRAAASDGSRYADLDTAYLYRKELVAGATCNGRDRFGLAPIDAKTDPTLRPGDIVATKSGLVAVTGMKDHVAEFSPIENTRSIPKSTRDKLAGVRIMPPSPQQAAPATMAATARAQDDNRRAQLSR